MPGKDSDLNYHPQKREVVLKEPTPRDHFLWGISLTENGRRVVEAARRSFLQDARKPRPEKEKALFKYRYQKVIGELPLKDVLAKLLRYWPEAQVMFLTDTTPAFPKYSYHLQRRPDVLLTDGTSDYYPDPWWDPFSYEKEIRQTKDASYWMLVRDPERAGRFEDAIVMRTSLTKQRLDQDMFQNIRSGSNVPSNWTVLDADHGYSH